jgi:pimeloyl-ACP methyl ester carboxylesterase
VSEIDVTLRDGRTLHVYDEGDPSGFVVFEQHGTPGSGTAYPPDLELARERGLRVVSYDRAGYGTSTPKPGRTVADVVADVEDVLDALDVDRFATFGASGGGPHVLAVAALLPERCAAAAVIASPTPWEAEDVDWLEGQGEQNLEEWAAALQGPEVLEAHLLPLADEIRAASAEDLRDLMVTLLPPVDRDVLTGDRAVSAKVNMDRAVAVGVAGWRDDDIAFTRPWGFELGAIRVPVLLWQGVQDKMVPASHGRWLAERIPGVEAHISEPDGHLSIAVGRLGEIYDWIASHREGRKSVGRPSSWRERD